MALTFLRNSAFITARKFGTMPPVAKFTKLSDGTPEDFQNAQIHFASLGSSQAIAKRLLGLVQGLEGLNIGNLVDLKVLFCNKTICIFQNLEINQQRLCTLTLTFSMYSLT